jgi:hypothetical protein
MLCPPDKLLGDSDSGDDGGGESNHELCDSTAEQECSDTEEDTPPVTNDCPICLDRICEQDMFRVAGCEHALCAPCTGNLASEGRQRFNCPYCRRAITNWSGDVPEHAAPAEAAAGEEAAASAQEEGESEAEEEEDNDDSGDGDYTPSQADDEFATWVGRL